jgi:hypothetical protein
MRVKCKWKTGDKIALRYTFNENPNVSSDWRLTTGQEYTVYAVMCSEEKTWYYVVDDAKLWFPMAKPAPLFEISDPRPSAYWRINFENTRDWRTALNSTEVLLIAPEEWCVDQTYYERLSDNNEREVAMFSERRKQMDAE